MHKKHPKPKFAKATPEGQQERLIQRGETAFNQRDYAQAITAWMGVAQPLRNEENLTRAIAEAHFRLGQIYLSRSPQRAIKDLSEAAMLCPSDALYAYHVGLAYHRQHSPIEASIWYQRALDRDPQFRRAALPMVLALIESGEDATTSPAWALLDESQRAWCQRQAGTDPISQALALYEAGNWQAARPLLLKAQTEKLSPLAQGLVNNYLGLIAQRENQPALALDLWRKAFDMGVRTDTLLYNLSVAYTLKAEAALGADKLEEVAAIAALGLGVSPENPRLTDLRAQSGLRLGYAAASAGDWHKAVQLWEPLPDLSGANARGLAANRAIAFERTGDLVKAAEAWREFVRRRSRKEDADTYITPTQVARLWMRISALYLTAQQPDEAVQTLQNALKYQPDDPDVSLVLAKTLADLERYEAAHKQLGRSLQTHPNHLESLVFKAELAESGSIGRFSMLGDRMPVWGQPPGIPEWEAVLATGDETYTPVAREHLIDLYGAHIEGLKFWANQKAAEQARKYVERMPDVHLLRARYVGVLLSGEGNSPKKKTTALVREQMALIDLTDVDALHHLIDVWHKVGDHAQAAALLELANAKKPLDASFYQGIADCALGREQHSIAQGYYAEAIRRAADPDTKGALVVEIAMNLGQHRQADTALSYLTDLQKEMPNFDLVYVPLAIIEMEKGNLKRAKEFIQRAGRWARRNKREDFLELIAYIRSAINGTLIPPGIGPAGFLPEDFEDADDFDLPGFLNIDEALDNQASYEPQTDSRRRRQNRQKRQQGGSGS